MKLKNLRKGKDQRGITLLALIVTIIILLILAGVSVAVLVGDNGIINNAVKAKRATDVAASKERVNLAVMAAKIESKKNKINLETVKSELEENGLTIVGDGDSFPLTVTDGVNKFEISETGNVKRILRLTAADIAANKEKYYGQEVINYTAGGRTYRIFYVDEEGYFGAENTIYLKADKNSEQIVDFNGIVDYTVKTKAVLEKMNKKWALDRLDAEESWRTEEKAMAYLCDPYTGEVGSNDLWEDYYDSSMASYVIGTPSIEMFVKSYNQVPHNVGNFEWSDGYNSTNYYYSPNARYLGEGFAGFRTGSTSMESFSRIWG